MRDDDRGDAEPLLELAKLDLHAFAQPLVERAERLVEQQHGGLYDQRPRQRDALLLAAGKRLRHALRIGVQLDHLERFRDAARPLALWNAAHLQAEGQVARHAHVREERVALE